MAEIMVTASELKSKAGTLKEYNSRFKAQVGNLESQEGRLVGMWEGEARNAFDKAFKSDKAQFDNFYNLIEQYVATLELIAAKYAQAEAQNVSTASTRSY